jgi:uncharacterized protein YjbJ (UPF0337 family)
MTVKDRVESEVDELMTLRDELKLKVHLGKMEAQELWEDLEKHWDQAEGKLKVLADASAEAAGNVGDAAEMVVAEVRSGYEKLRNLLD